MSRRQSHQGGAAGREPVTEATVRADSRAYVEAKLAYHLAFSELWADMATGRCGRREPPGEEG